jgi:hypothetical protein
MFGKMRTLLLIAAALVAGCGPSPPTFDYVTHLQVTGYTNLTGAYSLHGSAQGGTSDVCGLALRGDGTFSITNIPSLPASRTPFYWFDELTNATRKWQLTPVGSLRGERVWGIAFSMPGRAYCVFGALSGRGSPYRLVFLQDARKLSSRVELEFRRMGR